MSIVGLCCLLYWPLHNAGWRFDDGHHLLFASRYSPWQYFFVPEIARLQSGAHFTPFNVLVYELCLKFGDDFPQAGYLFHFGLVLAIGGLVWRYVRISCGDKGAAWISTLLFVTGFPVIGATNMLMVGHYLIGAVFFLLFLLRYETYSRHRRGPDVVLCVVYFLACLSKEIYVVAPAVILLDRRPASRIFHVIALGATLVVFWLVRSLVLHRLVGSYDNQLGGDQWGESVWQLLSGGLGYFLAFPVGYALAVMIGIVGLLASVNMWRQRGWLGGSSAVVLFFLACLGPLLPVAGAMDPGNYSGVRWLFFPWLAFSLIAGSVAIRSPNTLGLGRLVVTACAAISLCYSIGYGYSSGFARESQRFDVLSRYVFDRDACHLVDSQGLSSWIADLARAGNISRSDWMVAPEPVLHALALKGTPICRHEEGSLRFAGIVNPDRVHKDLQSSLSLAIVYTGTHATIQFQSALKGRLAFYKPGQYLLYLAPNVSYPLPNPERFNHFQPVVIGEDGVTVIVGPLIDFSPLVPGTWRWERRV